MDWKEAQAVVEEISQKTKKNAYSLVLDPEKEPSIFDSKFGGLPYWDMEKEYPKGSNGKNLMLLAQINFGQMFQEVEKDGLLPDTGMLQFFIALDDVYGMDFNGQGEQKDFRVVYHASVNCQLDRAQVESLGVPVSTDVEMEEFTPIWAEIALKITKQEVSMGEADYRFSKIFREAMQEKYGKQYEGEPLYQILDDETYDKLIGECSEGGHWLLGYPYFTQTDPREYEEQYRYYDTMLFQMDSDYGEDGDYIMWGDSGVANFFINQEDLKKRDFSKILYNWDCC